ncbi:MAG: hypothetical protein PHD73_10800, partial [Sediminibacterium sp.]|nr:hypothetical protein [Sediminibacterium sp.]
MTMSRTRKFNVKTQLAIVLTLFVGILTFHTDELLAKPMAGVVAVNDTIPLKKDSITAKKLLSGKD